MLAMRYHGTGPWYKDCGVQGYKYRTKIWFPLTKVHHRVQHWREIRAPRMNIILSSGHSPARHLDNGKRRGNSKHSWRSPPRDAERKEENSARGNVEDLTQNGKWIINTEQVSVIALCLSCLEISKKCQCANSQRRRNQKAAIAKSPSIWPPTLVQ